MSAVIIDRPEPYVLRVTINRPDARNAVNREVAQQLGAAVKEAEADHNVRCVILTGAGERAFCAGADLKEVSAGRIQELVTADAGFAGFVWADRQKPWIAAVNGAALAGGMEILLSCDMSVVADRATFGLPEVKRGLAALAGGLYRLPRAIPKAIALELIATGDTLSAKRAFELGLVNYVVPEGAVMAEALSLAKRIAANAPIAVRESLSLARRCFDEPQSTLADASERLGRRLASTEDYQEGPRAFIEKREPRWTGR